MNILEIISRTCSCTMTQAAEYLDGELDHLRRLLSMNNFHYQDLEAACENLGLEYDYIPFFTYYLLQ